MRALTYTETVSTSGSNAACVALGITGALSGGYIGAQLSAIPAFLFFLRAFEARNRNLSWYIMGAFGCVVASTTVGMALGGGVGLILASYSEPIEKHDISIIKNTTNTTNTTSIV